MHHFGIEHEAFLRQEELLREAQERRLVLAASSSRSSTRTLRRSLLRYLLRVSWRKREQWGCLEAVGRTQTRSAAERLRGLSKH
jgi:hypothetical protein